LLTFAPVAGRSLVSGLFICWFACVSWAVAEPKKTAAAVVSQPDDVVAALHLLDENNIDDHWYFTMRIVEGDEVRLVHSDPALPRQQRRQLVAIDGQLPGDKALAEFREAEIKRVQEEDPETSGYAYLVDPGSLQLLSQDGRFAAYSFRPRVAAMEEAQEQLQGSLVFDHGQKLVQRLEIRNAEPLAPAFSVPVDLYRLTFLFGAGEDARLLRRMESHAVGKAGFVKSFESLVEIDFGEYRPVGIPQVE